MYILVEVHEEEEVVCLLCLAIEMVLAENSRGGGLGLKKMISFLISFSPIKKIAVL